jgi:hypothetical protein
MMRKVGRCVIIAHYWFCDALLDFAGSVTSCPSLVRGESATITIVTVVSTPLWTRKSIQETA